MSEVTRILNAIEQGDRQAAEDLLPLVYDELRKLAAQRLAHEQPGQTLNATALVHEAYLRLAEVESASDVSVSQWNSRGHFFAAAAEAMRRILVDNARQKGREKHGGKMQRLDIDAVDLATRVAPDQLLAIDEALAKLSVDDPMAAQIVKLRYFAGLSVDEAGTTLGIATATAYRHWNYARAWLYSELLGNSDA